MNIDSLSMKVTLVQSDIEWEKSNNNLREFGKLIKSVTEPTDLFILPELFTTGFTMNVSSFAEGMSGNSVKWMSNIARSLKVYLTGSLLINEQGRYYNRLLWMKPTGQYFTYDKRHLFRMGEEHLHYSAGESKLIVELHRWKIRPLICYDLRFPVWSRNLSDYDLLIYVANWPSSRRTAWETLLKARAIENQCYVIGLNRIGKDGMGITYSGDSQVIDFKGNILKLLRANTKTTETVRLNLQELREFRKKFPVYLDADKFEIL